MRTSIRWRLVMMYVMLVVIVMMVSGTMIVLTIRDTEEQALSDDVKEAIALIKNSLPEEVSRGELDEELLKFYQTNTTNFHNKRVFILDTSGKVILPQKDTDKAFITHQVVGAIEDGSSDAIEPYRGQALAKYGDDKKYIGYADNIKVEGQVTYIIYALGDASVIDTTVSNAVVIILMSVAVAFVIAVVLGYVFSDFLTKPIYALTLKAKAMAEGELDQPMKVYSNDEIGQLTRNFNRMANSLNETLNEVISEKNKLEIVFEHMTDGILVFDRMGVLIHANPASVDMLKLGRQISFQEIFKPYMDETFADMKASVMEETISRLVKASGKYYSVYFAKFLDQNKEAVGLICVIQDITEHKMLEAMQKEFVANVSHELRTPLTTIKSYAETMLEGSVDDEATAKRFLGVINHEADRMTALVQDLLDLSKLDNSQVNIAMNQLNLAQMLQDSVEKYLIHSEKKKQRLIYTMPEFECWVMGDMGRIEQVIKNIISNAVKYSQEEAEVKVDVVTKGKYFVVSVTDNGFGIPKEDVSRIFERFYRVDKARSREMGGTGLGLAIAKEIMELHGGKIDVRSELGTGSTFELYFPISKRKLSVSQ